MILKPKVGLIFLMVFALSTGTAVTIISADGSSGTWTGDITIKSDGSVDPSNAPVSRSGSTYRLTANVEGTIEIQKSWVTLDGMGYQLIGDSTGSGVLVDGSLGGYSGITVKRLTIKYFTNGISFINVTRSRVTGNRISSVSGAGVSLFENCRYNRIWDNVIKDSSSYGILIDSNSNSNVVIYNVISRCYIGISCEDGSSRNKLYYNSISEVEMVGINIVDDSNKNIVRENGFKGSDYYGIYMRSCSQNSIKGNAIYNIAAGISMYESDNNSIMWNMIADITVSGIEITFGSNCNRIMYNTIRKGRGDGWYGINIVYSDRVLVRENNIKDFLRGGIYIYESSYISIKGNGIYNIGAHALLFYGSMNNRIMYNIFSGSYWGVAMGLCSGSLFKYNVIKDNDYAFWIQGSRGNTLYLNDIKGNTAPFDKSTDLGMTFTEQSNTWYKWCKGNYWSDYTGQDTDGDWIGDTNLPHNGVDYYPLMGPYN